MPVQLVGHQTPSILGTWGLRVGVGLDRMGRKNWGKIPSISALNYELTNHTQFISFPPFMPIFDLRNCPLICCWWWWCWELWRKVQRTRNAEQVFVAFFALLIPLAFLLTFNVLGGRSFTGTRTPLVGWDGIGDWTGRSEAIRYPDLTGKRVNLVDPIL